ncbi:MAG: TonB-dependent receptor [Gemmatimonadetes bacterium]|nr:TonB-dependent receptor [Gemmatimonadota bacterium]
MERFRVQLYVSARQWASGGHVEFQAELIEQGHSIPVLVQITTGSPLAGPTPVPIAAVLASLPEEASWDVRRFVVHALQEDPIDLRVDRLARRAGVARRTLSNHLAHLGLLSPHAVLQVCRLVRAAYAMSFDGLPAERAAHEVGIGRVATMRSLFKARFGMTPREFRPQARASIRPPEEPIEHGAWLRMLSGMSDTWRRRARLSGIVASLLTTTGEAEAFPWRGTVEGRVHDAVSGQALAAATVTVEGTPLFATSDSQGAYRIVLPGPGPYVIRAIRIGYAPARHHLLQVGADVVRLDFALTKSALNLPNLTVTADPAGRAKGELGTASVIESEAIRGQVAASVAGLLELIPGVSLSPPGLDAIQQFALRAVAVSPGGSGGAGPNVSGPSASALASFGTQIVLDGVPLSNNINLQSLGPRGELGFSTAAGGGIDLRRLPASTIERVEVIRGIPSARFGDLTQGVVLVDTRAGAVAPEARARVDPRTLEVTMIGGAGLGRSQTGTASINLARTTLVARGSENTGSRISGQLAHRVAASAFTLDSRFDFFQVLSDQPESSRFPGAFSRNRDHGVRVSGRLRWRLSESSALEVTSGLDVNRQRSTAQAPMFRAAMPFTDRLTEGTQEGKFIGGVYLSRVDLSGEPRHIYSRVELVATPAWIGGGGALRGGVELRREWNGGPGYQFAIEFPPQTTFNGVEGFDRPRSFDSIPALVSSSLYLDHRRAETIGSVSVSVQAGVRLDLLHRGGSWTSTTRDRVVSPRLQVEVVPRNGVRWRLGVGKVAKIPALASLFPGSQYYDLVNFNYYANDPAERRAVLTTRILDRTNPHLAIARGWKLEAGLEVDLGADAQLSFVAYSDRVQNGVGLSLHPTFVVRERLAIDSATIGTGRPPATLPVPLGQDTIPTLIDRPSNNLRLASRGVEATLFLPEWTALRTRIAIQGAWSRSRLASSGIELNERFEEFQLIARYPRVPYWEALERSGELLIVTGRVIHHQPRAGLMLMGTFQLTPREQRRDIGAGDTLAFAGYLTSAGLLVPVAVERRGAAEYADLRIRRVALFNPERSPFGWLFSFQASKTIPRGGRLSFYAYNAFDLIGSYGTRSAASRLYPAVRFGLEVSMPVGGGSAR